MAQESSSMEKNRCNKGADKKIREVSSSSDGFSLWNRDSFQNFYASWAVEIIILLFLKGNEYIIIIVQKWKFYEIIVSRGIDQSALKEYIFKSGEFHWSGEICPIR